MWTNSTIFFWKKWESATQKQVGRVLLVSGCVAFLIIVGFVMTYHRNWFNVPFSKVVAIKVTFKALKWIAVAVAFWFGKEWFSKKTA